MLKTEMGLYTLVRFTSGHRLSQRVGRLAKSAMHKRVVSLDATKSQASEIIDRTGFFDPDWYLYRYADVRTYATGPLAHFYLHGASELRDPSPYLNLARFLSRHPNARSGSAPALLEAIVACPSSEIELCALSDDVSFEYLLLKHGLFDEAWYLARNRDVAIAGLEPIGHFIHHGAVENRDPGPAFDSDFYRVEHPEYVDESRTAVEHFLRFGARRGYIGVGPPPYEQWLRAFDQLTPQDLERISAEGASMWGRILAVHVIDAKAASCFGPILAAWRGQVGVDGHTCFLRGAAVSDDLWASCVSQAAGRPGVSAVSAVAELPHVQTGTILIFCAGAHLVRPHAAYVFALTLAQVSAEAAYADHDHIDAEGVRSAPAFKPAMSPEFMRRIPYAGALMAHVATAGLRDHYDSLLADAAGGNAERSWANFLLSMAPGKVAHAPFLLSHKLLPSAPDSSPESMSTARQAPGMDESVPSVAIIIPTRDRSELLRECVDSIRVETDYPVERVTILVVDNGSREAATLAYFAQLATIPGVQVVPSPGPFNFSTLCNDGAAHAHDDILVFLNNDTTVLRHDWLRELVEQARQPDVGVVGAHLLFPDDSTQHGGVVLGVRGVGAHRVKLGAVGPAGRLDVTREMAAVTGACLAVKRTLFEDLLGFDPILRVAFNDVDLCARAFAAGFRNIYIGKPLFHHHESKSRGLNVTREKRHRHLREANYVRERFAPLFRDDPTYSPNLSLDVVDKLARPPRVIRPWRRTPPGSRSKILLLCYQHSRGQGVATVMEQQALFLRDRGWDVSVGGPTRGNDLVYEGCTRVNLWTPEDAAAYALSEGIHCIVAHTPPFFSITRYLGAEPLVYFMDHGEPPAHLFPDREAREDVDWEKRFCASFARRVFVISRTVQNVQQRRDTVLIRNGNSHLSIWSDDWAGRRDMMRKTLGFEDCFVVLKVCRFGPADRVYKGVNRYGDVASDLPFMHPELNGKIRFILVGRGDPDDVAVAEAMGLDVHPNVSDAELVELYVASDLYMSFSDWEGYNLGIGQALAMGLPVIASDIGAHREFGIEVLDSVPQICEAVVRRYASRHDDLRDRHPWIEPWTQPLTILAESMEKDLAGSQAPVGSLRSYPTSLPPGRLVGTQR